MSDKNTKRDFRSEARPSGAQRRAMEHSKAQTGAQGATTTTGQKPEFLKKVKSQTSEDTSSNKEAPSPGPSTEDQQPAIAAPSPAPQDDLDVEQNRHLAHGILATHKKELKDLPLKAIRSWPFKDRNLADLKGDASFEEIQAEIRAYGLVVPPLIRAIRQENGTYIYEEVYGFKRIEAARIAKIEVIPALVIYDLSDEDAMIIQSTENVGRSSPSAWNKAKSILAYHEQANITFADIETAAKIGHNPKTINNLLRIARNMPLPIAEALDIHRFGQDTLKEIVGGTGSPSEHKDRKAFIDLVIEKAEILNARPKQAKRVIARLRREVTEGSEASSPKSNVREVCLENGKPAFSWKIGSRGGSLKIHPDILPHITEQDLEKFANSILKKRQKQA